MLLFRNVAFKIHDHERNNGPVMDRLVFLNDFSCSLALLHSCAIYICLKGKQKDRLVADNSFRNNF